jgi:hypothetical protein
MDMAPRQEFIENVRDRELSLIGHLGGLNGIGHQGMVFALGLYFVGTEIVAFASDGDEPGLTIFAEPGFRDTSHVVTLQQVP